MSEHLGATGRTARVERLGSHLDEWKIPAEELRVVAAADIRSVDVVARLAMTGRGHIAAQWNEISAVMYNPEIEASSSVLPEVKSAISGPAQDIPEVLIDQPVSRRAQRVTIQPEPPIAVVSERTRDEGRPLSADEAVRGVRFASEVAETTLPSADDCANASCMDDDIDAAANVTVKLDVDGDQHGLLLSWPPYEAPEAQVVFFRVAGDAKGQPPNSNGAALVTSARECSWHDLDGTEDAPFRFVQVWSHRGESTQEAMSSEPVLHAAATVVPPPSQATLTPGDRRVTGSWNQRAGMAVQVSWRRGSSGNSPYQPLASSCVAESGFTHSPAPSGQRLEYKITALAEVPENGVRHPVESLPLTRFVDLEARVAAVSDLAGTPAENDTFDLHWTGPPEGTVEIYWSSEEPTGIARLESVPQDQLTTEDSGGLRLDQRLAPPVSDVGSQTSMLNVPWPAAAAGASRLYLIPVVKVGNLYSPGRPWVMVRKPPRVEHLRLLDRVDTKLLIFAWPSGAEFVEVYKQAQNEVFAAESGNRLHGVNDFTEQDYIKRGGLVLGSGQLGIHPQKLQVVSAVRHSGMVYRSDPASVQYRGMHTIEYQLCEAPALQSQVDRRPPKRRRRRKGDVDAPDTGSRTSSIQVQIRSNVVWRKELRFQLVHHADRFPLVANTDQGCTVVETFEVSLPEEGKPFTSTAFPRNRCGPGFMRLFLLSGTDEDSPPVALLDPPMSQLRI